MNISDVQEQKSVLLQVIQNNLDAWDKTAEDAARIFEANQLKFEKMQELEESLEISEALQLRGLFKKQFKTILKQQKVMMHAVVEEKKSIQDQLDQLGQKNKVVSNYIAIQNKSLFIEKNY